MTPHRRVRPDGWWVEPLASLVGTACALVLLWHMIAHADMPAVDEHFVKLAVLFAFSLGVAFNRPVVRMIRAYRASKAPPDE